MYSVRAQRQYRIIQVRGVAPCFALYFIVYIEI